ncbi:FRG domain-containing protein [Cryobacterium sp. Y62]|uniref:FRG domain-containing protein n=1 Tax=Cryobacterium sp. Y62 TaxID=2048284 RepID=UPI001304BAC1|nr:FRG domain-containing protein [Cryobacterium sp. Y62]
MPTEALASLQRSLTAASSSAVPEQYWQQLLVNVKLLSESVSVPALYSPAQLVLRNREQRTDPRPSRSAEAFFDEHSVEITDVRSLLKALSAIQTQHHMHRLVWRGQQNASWSVHSSLYRKVEASERASEDRLIAAEVTGMEHAHKWGELTAPAMKFFADMQHSGAPTRLLDATLDPEIAAWFAIEANPDLDDKDGRVVAWGRSVRTSARQVSKPNDDLPARDDAPFWHSWTTDEERGRVGWGTGSRTWSWFPPALSDRMRAQRAGFLLEAAPLVTPTVARVLSAGVTHDWRVAEITRATSIVGLPSRHDVRTTQNEANLVPVFSLRIMASAKPAIRAYLESKGLYFSAVYPDRGGLVDYLRGPFGLDRQEAIRVGTAPALPAVRC